MNSKVNSLEEKVKLPPTETISRCYQPQQSNRKVIRILTVAVYVLAVSLAAIMLSLYYIFIWDPTIRPFVTKANHCDKIVIPEKIAIRLLNSSEVSAEQFYKHILEQYRIHNRYRQQFLQKQHLQLQQLDATNRFQEIFATATIIQAHSRDTLKKPLTPTNGTFRLEPQQQQKQQQQQEQQPPAALPPAQLPAQQRSSMLDNAAVLDDVLNTAHMPLLLDTSPPSSSMPHSKRKTHRGHYKHHRGRGNGNGNINGNGTRNHAKKQLPTEPTPMVTTFSVIDQLAATPAAPHSYMDTPLNPPAGTIVQEPLQLYTSMPIPLILNSSEEKRPAHHAHGHGERRSNAQARRRTTTATVSGYDAQTYLNPFLTGELIFEK